jgi:hypothetical protein
MLTNVRRKLALGAIGVVGLAGLGVGVAAAQTTSPAPPKAPVTAPAPATQAPADGDALQQGDQKTPDVPGAAQTPEKPGAETPEKPGVETEKPGAEEPGDANLPGGGHADPVGQNVDHQFEGVE